jgi:Family of unknown function (DUF5994)
MPRYLRMRRRAPVAPGGKIVGGWWPRSLDLAAELRPLLVELRSEGYDVERVLYAPGAWGPAPDALTTAGRGVRLEPARDRRDPAISLIAGPGSPRTELAVIPPGTEPRIALRILALAERGGDLTRAVASLAAAGS